jgi:cob(I)alamin adenosyltransferase
MRQDPKIQVYTGEGKGKTTAALGVAWQAVGRGLKVFMIQFLKSPASSGEHFAAEAFGGMLTIKPMGKKGFIRRKGGDSLDTRMAVQAMETARTATVSGEYDIVILDEINVAIHLGLIAPEAVLELIDSIPEQVQLVLTGRYAHPEIIKRADCVLEMKKIKHPFDLGLEAREGIEF